jgi:fructose transport system permease protein
MTTAVATPTAAPRRSLGVARLLRDYPILGPLAALILAVIFFSTQTQNFVSGARLSFVLQQMVVVGTLAIGQTLVILTGGIDLSCGMVMALSSVLMTGLFANAGLAPSLAILLAFAACIAFGVVNGWLVTAIGLPPFIVTLGTYSIGYSLVRMYTTATITSVPPSLLFFGETFRIGSTAITYGSLVMLVLYAIAWFVLRSTPAGRAVYAVGDNPEAARLAGIHTARVLMAVYVLAALICGVGALLQVGRMGVGDPQAGQDANLQSITAVVLGGTSLLGGRGNVLGTLVGALIVGVFRMGLQLMGVAPIAQTLITGVLLILTASLDFIAQRAK